MSSSSCSCQCMLSLLQSAAHAQWNTERGVELIRVNMLSRVKRVFIKIVKIQ